MAASAPGIEQGIADGLPAETLRTDEAELMGEGDLFNELQDRGWIVTDGGNDAQIETYLQSPDGATYIAWTPDGTVHTDANEQVCWTIAACPPAPYSGADPDLRSHTPLLLDGVVVQRPAWTVQLTARTPVSLIDHLVTWLDTHPHGRTADLMRPGTSTVPRQG